MKRHATAVAALGTLLACGEATAPAPSFDASQMRAGVAVIERVANARLLNSLDAVSRSVSVVGSAGHVTAMAWSPGLEQSVRRLSATAVDAGTSLIPVMRASVLGTTFVYDPSVRQYVPDPARRDAPSNGVRFILYDVGPNENPLAGREIGYADLTDERRSSASVAGIRLEATIAGVSRLAYSFDLTGSLDRARFDVFGFMSDGSDRLEFAITTSQQLFGRGGAATLDATLYVPQEDFEVKAKLSGTAGDESGDGDVDLTIRSRVDEVRLAAKTINGRLDATFSANGQLIATAAGDPRAPVVRGADGGELSDEALQAIGEIVEMAQGIFAFVSQLLQPAGALLLLALGVEA